MIQYNEKDIKKLKLCLDTLVNQLNHLEPISKKLCNIQNTLKETDNKILYKQYNRAFSSFRKSLDMLMDIETTLLLVTDSNKDSKASQNIVDVEKTETFEDTDFDDYVAEEHEPTATPPKEQPSTNKVSQQPFVCNKEVFTITENGKTREGTEEERLKFKSEFEKSMQILAKDLTEMHKAFDNKFASLNNRANSLFKSLGL